MASWKEKWENLKNKHKKMATKAEAGAQALLSGAEVGATAFGAGYARARFGENGVLELAGVDASLVFGGGLHVLAFLNMFGKYDEHIHNVGNGFFGEYLGQKGYEFGLDAKKTAGTADPRQLADPSMRTGAVDSAFDRAAMAA